MAQMRLNDGCAFSPAWLACLPAILSCWLAALLACGCASHRGSPTQRYAEAKALFDHTAREFHLPSAEAQGAKKEELLHKSVQGYESLLKNYSDQELWCAQALRSLANIQAVQGHLDKAVSRYDQVAQKYPKQDWEVLQSWKSAGDLLWDSGKEEAAKVYYRKIVDRFDNPEGTALYRLIVKSAKTRLSSR